MELKSVKPVVNTAKAGVLIVPLWNWNQGTVAAMVYLNGVLIVPLWNWNSER